jgi:transcriptional regulator GlxA family with amidase domain
MTNQRLLFVCSPFLGPKNATVLAVLARTALRERLVKTKREMHSTSSSHEPKTTDVRVSLMLELLNEARCRSLDFALLSGRCNLSRSRIQHLFKTQTGMTLGRHFKQVKLLRAKQLLERSFRPVKEIAFTVGCQDISHFVRDYKLLFGETPSESRRRSRYLSGS